MSDTPLGVQAIMNQETLQEGITKHLDSLAATVRLGLGVAILFWWAGVQNQAIIEAFGMEVRRADALLVACIFYLFLDLAILDKFLRIGDLVREIDDDGVEASVTRLATHPWIANPFAYFGGTRISRIHSSKGFGALIVTWWVCNSSL